MRRLVRDDNAHISRNSRNCQFSERRRFRTGLTVAIRNPVWPSPLIVAQDANGVRWTSALRVRASWPLR